MTRPLLLLSALLALPLACGGDDDDDDDGSGSSNSNTGGSNTNPSTTAPSDTSSSMETCDSAHACVNDVCECTTPGLEGMACTNDAACVAECEICM